MVESNGLLIHRICLPYTQGSNPCFSYYPVFERTIKNLTKKGIVVQLVRAPPCHGGSCEFESRQSRIKISLSIRVERITLYYYYYVDSNKKI